MENLISCHIATYILALLLVRGPIVSMPNGPSIQSLYKTQLKTFPSICLAASAVDVDSSKPAGELDD